MIPKNNIKWMISFVTKDYYFNAKTVHLLLIVVGKVLMLQVYIGKMYGVCKPKSAAVVVIKMVKILVFIN